MMLSVFLLQVFDDPSGDYHKMRRVKHDKNHSGNFRRCQNYSNAAYHRQNLLCTK